MKFAGIIVDVKASTVDRIFHYEIPQKIQDLAIGHRVLVPFGGRKLEGYVIELCDQIDFDPAKVRPIIKKLDPKPLLTKEQIAVAQWMAEEYASLLSIALQLFLPAGIRYGSERVKAKTQLQASLNKPEKLTSYLAALSPQATRQKQTLNYLGNNSPVLASELCKATGATYSTLNALQDKGFITMSEAVIERSIEFDCEEKAIPVLNDAQEQALAEIRLEFEQQKRPVLLHGVTGSGKTEIYLRAMKECIAAKRQAIVMVPEIALTQQTIARFKQRFPGQIAVLHSGLSEGERYDQWYKIYRGEVDIVIGARSAVFAPLKDIGLIILDEEHETTYKQEDGSLKYHTRSVAIKRAGYHQAMVIMGSATPAIESYHNALSGRYRLVELPERVNNMPLPEITVIDMRQEFNEGNRTMFSKSLHEALESTLERGEQAIIFMNRRGYSSFVLCRECGYVIECPNCQVSLTYHQSDHSMHCHYCGVRESLAKSCPNCASRYLRQFGTGTEQVEQFVKTNFPAAKTVRLDADTTSRKGAHYRLLNSFRTGDSNVLIGTQMIAKGLDFPNVTLVGVLSADMILNFPDFRAAEHTFQLVSQVSGRAGRDLKSGQVIVQCYDPSHYILKDIQTHDYTRFYRHEISYRRQLHYPPFGHLTRILMQGPSEETASYAHELYPVLQQKLRGAEVFRPAPAPISKIKGRYRYQILIKSQVSVSRSLSDLPQSRDVNVSVDGDPLVLL